MIDSKEIAIPMNTRGRHAELINTVVVQSKEVKSQISHPQVQKCTSFSGFGLTAGKEQKQKLSL
jgi:hypothetical protein